jgi:hypothetical protein
VRCDEIVVGLCPRRCAAPILQLTRDEDHGIAGDRELARAGLAPQIELGLAVVADLKRRNSF